VTTPPEVRPKIAHVAYGGLGGHAAFLRTLLSAETAADTEHQAVFYGVEPARQELVEEFDARDLPFTTVVKRSLIDPRGMWKTATWLRRHRPEAVFFHTTQPLGAVRVARWITYGWNPALIVVERHANHLKSRRDWALSLLGSWLADTVVFLTVEHEAGVSARLGRRRGPAHVEIIPNGVDTTRFRPGAPRRRDATELVLGMQSRLIAIKDHPTLLRAIAKARCHLNLRLELAGEGSSRAALESLARELGIEDIVTFHGMLDERELVQFLQRLDIYVHATLGETMSNAILQAMAVGAPIVGSRVPGVENLLVDDETALLVQPRDVDALVLAIRRLANDQGLAAALGRNARSIAEARYGHGLMAQRYRALVNTRSARQTA
jgi:glycosyltransferase involved in cell wall biosynthesis